MYRNTTLASKHAECIEILINWFIWLLAEEMPVQLGQVRKKVGEGANPKELCSVSSVFLVKSGKPFAKPALVDICKQCVWYLLAKYLHTMIFEEGNTACLAFLAWEALTGSETSNQSNGQSEASCSMSKIEVHCFILNWILPSITFCYSNKSSTLRVFSLRAGAINRCLSAAGGAGLAAADGGVEIVTWCSRDYCCWWTHNITAKRRHI